MRIRSETELKVMAEGLERIAAATRKTPAEYVAWCVETGTPFPHEGAIPDPNAVPDEADLQAALEHLQRPK